MRRQPFHLAVGEEKGEKSIACDISQFLEDNLVKLALSYAQSDCEELRFCCCF